MRVFCVVSKFQSLLLPTSASSMLTSCIPYFTAALALQCSVAPLTNLTDFEDSHTESGAWHETVVFLVLHFCVYGISHFVAKLFRLHHIVIAVSHLVTKSFQLDQI